MPGPALAVPRRSQQPVHHPGESARGGVGQEGLHVVRSGRQPGQVVGGAAQQHPLGGRWGRFQPRGFQPGQHEGVDGGPDPFRPLDPGQMGPPGRLEGPEVPALLHPGRFAVLLDPGRSGTLFLSGKLRLLRLLFGPGRPLLHPSRQHGHLLGRQRPPGRHLGPGVLDGTDQQAGGRVLRIDRRTLPAALQHGLPGWSGAVRPGR